MASSYENPHTCSLIHLDEDTVFRRVPVAGAFDTDRDRAGHCSADTGHVLYFVADDGQVTKIKCKNCPAAWKDEGF